MNDFKIRKVLTYPSSDFVPNTMYMKKSSADKFELKMAASDGSSLYRLWTPADIIEDSGTTLSGATAAKYSTQTTVNINTSGTLGANITSYDITVNNGPVTNTTDLDFTFTMSDTPGDMMVIVVKPKDDIGTVYRLASYSVLTTNGVPLDSGLEIAGVTQLPEHETTTLTLSNYSSSITGFDYTVGLSSTQYIAVGSGGTTDIDVSPIGEVGQSIPIKVTPVDTTPDEYLSVIHDIILQAELPVTTPIDVILASSTPINETTELQVSTTNPDITKFVIEVGTSPSTIYTIAGTAGSVDLDFALANVGDDVPVKITPIDDDGTTYVPYTTTMHVDAAAITNSGVTITGDNSVASRDSYTITMNNSNGDITQYAIKWNGVSQGTTPSGASDWTKIMVLETGGTTLDLVVTPLSNTDKVYASITKTIDVTARAAVFSGMQVTGPVEIPINETLVLPFDNIPTDIASFDVTWDGAALTPLGGTETEFSRVVTEAVGTTISVVITPKSTDTDVVWFPITHNVTVTAAEAIDSGMTVTNDLTIEIGDTETFYFDKPSTVTEIKVYRDGTYITTTTANSYTTPVENGVVGDIVEYTFQPLSSGTLVFEPVEAKYEVVSTVAIDSGYDWTIPALTPRWNTETWIRSGATNGDVGSWEISVNGVAGATQAADYSSRSTGELSDPVGTRITATFTPISLTGKLYKAINATTVIGESELLPASAISGNPDVTLANYTQSFAWNIVADSGYPPIAGYNLIGDDIDDIINGTAANPSTPLLGRTRAGETATILLQAYTSDGRKYEPLVRKITVDNWNWGDISVTVDGVSALAADTSEMYVRDKSIFTISSDTFADGYEDNRLMLAMRVWCPALWSGYDYDWIRIDTTDRNKFGGSKLEWTGTFEELFAGVFDGRDGPIDAFKSARGEITVEFILNESNDNGFNNGPTVMSCVFKHVNWLDFNLRQASSMPDSTSMTYTTEADSGEREDFADWDGTYTSDRILDDLTDYSDRLMMGYGTNLRIDHADYGDMMIVAAGDWRNKTATLAGTEDAGIVAFFGIFKYNHIEKRWYGVKRHRGLAVHEPVPTESYPETSLDAFSYNNLLCIRRGVDQLDVWDYTSVTSMLSQDNYNQATPYGVLAYTASIEPADLIRENDFNKFMHSTFMTEDIAVLIGPGPSQNAYMITASGLTKITENVANPRSGSYAGLKQHRRSEKISSNPSRRNNTWSPISLTAQLLPSSRAWGRYQRLDIANGEWKQRLICDPGDAAAVYGVFEYRDVIIVPYRPNGGYLKIATFDSSDPEANLGVFDITGEVSTMPVIQQIDAKDDLLAASTDTAGFILNVVAENGLIIIMGGTKNTQEIPIIQYGFNPTTRLYELLPVSKNLGPMISANTDRLDIFRDRTIGAGIAVLPNIPGKGYGMVFSHPLRISPWGRNFVNEDTNLGAWYFLD